MEWVVFVGCCLVTALAFTASRSAQAAENTFLRPGHWFSMRFGVETPFASEQEAIDATVASFNAQHGEGQCSVYAVVSDWASSWFGDYRMYSFGKEDRPNFCTSAVQIGYYYSGACPAGTTNVGGMPQRCACPSGQVWDGAQCSEPISCVAGEKQYFSFAKQEYSLAAITCDGHCEVNAHDGICTSGGCFVTATKTGATCAVSNVPSGTPSGGTCEAQGKCPATVNGVEMCLTCGVPGTDYQKKTRQDTVNADGSSTVTEITKIGNVDGSVITIKETIIRDVNGNVTGTTTTTETAQREPTEQEAFCAENPQSPMCKIGVWSGSCGAFVCDGDAVQCAQALAVWELTCEAKAQSSSRTLGEQVVAGADPQAGSLPNPANPDVVDLSTAINKTGWLGRSCPADQTFEVYGGTSVTLPFSELCVYFEIFGAIMLIAASVGSARIVGVI